MIATYAAYVIVGLFAVVAVRNTVLSVRANDGELMGRAIFCLFMVWLFAYMAGL